jgi:hypothetical protein
MTVTTLIWSKGVGVDVERASVTALWSHPLASAPYVIGSLIRVYRVLCGHGERWFTCPRCTPFICAA